MQSMTGFGRAERLFSSFKITWQLKSINHRFLECKFRLPDASSFLELTLRERVKAKIERGVVEGVLRFERDVANGSVPMVDDKVLDSLLAVEKNILAKAGKGKRARLSLDRLLSWPGIMVDWVVSDLPGLDEAIFLTLDEALDNLLQTRQGEGGRLQAEMASLLDEMAMTLAQIEALLPQTRINAQKRIQEQVASLTALPIEEQRLAQELAFLLARLDVQEECARLRSHLQEGRNILGKTQSVGKQLDFLCQEMNREANTICSKSQESDVTRLGMAIKLAVEKVREQVQNIQ